MQAVSRVHYIERYGTKMDKEQLKMLPKGEVIKIRGANEHNLKNIDLDIPRNKFVVLTGCPALANRPLHLIPSMRKGRDGIWNLCPPMPDSFWDRWRSPM